LLAPLLSGALATEDPKPRRQVWRAAVNYPAGREI